MKSKVIVLSRAAGIRSALTAFGRQSREHLVLLCAAQASFFLMTSCVPFLSLFMAVAAALLPRGLAGSPLPAFWEQLGVRFDDPPAVRLLSFHAVTALWTASRGVGALRSGLERIYGEARFGKRTVFRRLGAVGATCGMLCVLTVSALTVSVLPLLSEPLSGLLPGAVPFLAALLPPGALTAAFVFLYAGAGRRSPAFAGDSAGAVSAHLPGAFFASCGWMLFSLFFSFYIRHFPRAEAVYGSLGAVCLFMLRLYFSSIIFLLGAEVNLFLSERKRGKAPPV